MACWQCVGSPGPLEMKDPVEVRRHLVDRVVVGEACH